MPIILTIRQADISEHKVITRIAKQSKYTSAFSNMIFSGEDCYTTGRIRVAETRNKVVGYTCFRHRKRNPATVLYFVGVDEQYRNNGIGARLLDDLQNLSPNGIVECNVMKDNPAVRLYQRVGYTIVGEAYAGKAWVMRNRCA